MRSDGGHPLTLLTLAYSGDAKAAEKLQARVGRELAEIETASGAASRSTKNINDAGGRMPYCAGLKQIKDAKIRRRTINGLKRRRPELVAAIPARTATDTLLLATWNIREFDSGKHGYRDDEPFD